MGLFPCSIFPITAGFTRPSFLPAPLCGGVHIRPTIFSSKDGVLVTRVPLFKVGGSFGNVFPVVIRDLINVKKTGWCSNKGFSPIFGMARPFALGANMVFIDIGGFLNIAPLPCFSKNQYWHLARLERPVV